MSCSVLRWYPSFCPSATGSDEMCNFYIMFYTDSSVEEPAGQCGGSRYPSLVKNMPADSDVPLPPNPLLDDVAHGHHHPHHHSAMGQSSPSLDETRVEPPGLLPWHVILVKSLSLSSSCWDVYWPHHHYHYSSLGQSSYSLDEIVVQPIGLSPWDVAPAKALLSPSSLSVSAHKMM